MDLWAYTNTVILDFSRRGTPTDNAAIESFNGRFREECLNVHWFARKAMTTAADSPVLVDQKTGTPHRRYPFQGAPLMHPQTGLGLWEPESAYV